MTFEEAKRLSLLKWEFLKKFDYKSNCEDELINELPELRKLRATCGFCEKYYDDWNCTQCPIYNKARYFCHNDNSLYSHWEFATAPETKREYASKMYELILSLEDENE